MSKFNVYMNSHFSAGGCRLIARARDTSRQRDVKLFAIPGHYDVVGVSDGVDAWVAPAAAGPFFKTATGDCVKLLQKLQAGEALPAVPDAPAIVVARRRVVLQGDGPPPPDPAALAAAAVTTRRRHVLFA